MEQYISKDAIVAEIKKKIRTEQGYSSGDEECGYRDCAKDILSFLDTLEVKEVKEPTASDRGMAEEIIINLKRVEQDYHIDLTREMEWVRNKTQKGE